MLSALFSGVAGLQNHQIALNVIGNNIANINTVGFKGGRTTFAETLVQRISGAQGPSGSYGGRNPVEIGLGMRLASIDQQFNQGNLEATGNTTDLAIQGDGFFILSDGEQNFYTRAGAFQMDANGYLIAQGGGLHVLGRMADSAGEIGGNEMAIQLPINEKAAARATTEIAYFCNLDASWQEQILTASDAFTTGGGANPALTTTEINTLDQVTAVLDTGDQITITGTNREGNPASATFTYGTDGTTLGDLIAVINTAFDSTSLEDGSTCTLDATGALVLADNTTGESETTINLGFVDAGSTVGAITLPSLTETQEGEGLKSHIASIYVYDSLGEQHRIEITFFKDLTTDNSWTWQVQVNNGDITPTSGDSGTATFNSDGSLATFAGGPLVFSPPGATTMEIDLNGGTQGSFEGITQFASPSTTIALNQDGYGMGILESFTIGTDGTVLGNFSNGVIRSLAQISLVRFINPGGLENLGGNLFRATMNSGEALIGINSDERGGTIHSGYLEMSNVDLSQQFTRMIVVQRGFQANARVITTSDYLLNEIINLKR